MSHNEPSREVKKELTVDTEYLDMMGRDMMCAYQPGIHGPGPPKIEIGEIFSVLGSLKSASRYDVSDWWWLSCRII